MANETVTPIEARLSLANDALLEITQISQTLRQFIFEKDAHGDVLYVARGMLARVQQLSEAVGHCIELRDEERPADAKIFEMIECRKDVQASAREVSHV